MPIFQLNSIVHNFVHSCHKSFGSESMKVLTKHGHLGKMQNVQWGPPVDWHIGHGSLALSESVKYCYWEALHQTIQYYSLIQNFSSDYLLFDMRLPNFETDRHMKTKMVISTNNSLSLYSDRGAWRISNFGIKIRQYLKFKWYNFKEVPWHFQYYQRK